MKSVPLSVLKTEYGVGNVMSSRLGNHVSDDFVTRRSTLSMADAGSTDNAVHSEYRHDEFPPAV